MEKAKALKIIEKGVIFLIMCVTGRIMTPLQ